MSDKKDINRRKVLSTAAGASAALVGTSAVAGAKRLGGDGDGELTTEELQAALDATTTRVRTSSDSAGGLRPPRSDAPVLSATDGPDVFVGTEKNARLPGAEPFAIETKEEFFQRDVPLHVANADQVNAAMFPDLYVEKELGDFSVGPLDVSMAVGTGVTVTVGPGEISISLSFDIWVSLSAYGRSASLTVTPAGMSFGISDEGSEGFCIDTGVNPSNLPGLDFELCGNVEASTDGDEVSIGFSAGLGDVCADVWVGEVCTSPPLSIGFSRTVDI